ncbi:Protein CREG1 [Portunus trituberculatus]|uniref:Protein CREG1 n=1 Tax=Portunus trituberculatus TaxID=210409 RepID=A0A5B7FI34_PORTR|nr:Protein CREG1 [Portunus trituberculatus]
MSAAVHVIQPSGDCVQWPADTLVARASATQPGSQGGSICGAHFRILSVSDGPVDKSSGTPYAYITRLDLCGKDLLTDDRASLAVSEAQSDYCKKVDLDPEDPRCARVLLSGTVEEVKNGTSEAEFAKEALFSRHPVMKTWPQKNHNWIFVKMNIKNIYVFDYFGGVRNVAVEDYYNAEL